MEKVYYIYARIGGQVREEKVGREVEDKVTAAIAARILSQRIEGTRKSPKEIREEAKAAAEAAQQAEANRWTISRLWKSYKENRPIKGITTDENRFKLYVDPAFGEKQPSEIIPLDIDRVRLNLTKTKSPATVRNVLELLRRIINFGVKRNLCNSLPFRIEMPRVSNQRTEDLTKEELANLLVTIENSPHEIAGAMMKMALFTGMRRGEMFRLQWKHVDQERGFIYLVGPKGGKDQTIPLNEAARELLKNLPERCQQSEFVFPGRNGEQRTDINKAVTAIKSAAGLPKEFRALHGLRHVFASMLASSGQVDLYTLQQLLTHKSPTMTMRYAHLRPGILQKASNLAGDIITASMTNIDEKIVSLKGLKR
jgi:integrase